MPRYFFHTADDQLQRDREGTELPDLATARREAIKFAGAVMEDTPEVLWDGHDFRVEVTDERGALLFTVVTLAVDAATGAVG